MAVSICLHNGTLITGFSKMENCAVLIEDGKIADVFFGTAVFTKKI